MESNQGKVNCCYLLDRTINNKQQIKTNTSIVRAQ